MSIYSTNRSGSMGIAQVAANESYKSVDIGRIMYESACNDQMMFEAVLASDFRELHGIREGTVLQSEIAALNEASLKDFAASAKTRLQEFWKKLKGAFKTAIQNIAAYILRDGKAFANKYREVAKKYTGKPVEVKGKVRSSAEVKVPAVGDLERYIRDNMNNESMSQKDYAHELLGKAAGAGKKLAPAEYRKEMLDKCFVDGAIKSDLNYAIEKMLERIEKASETTKELTRAEKQAEGIIRDAGSRISAAAKDTGNKNAVKQISLLVSACETVLSTTTATAIKVVKMDVSNNRKLLGKLMSEMKGENKTVSEAAAMAAEDEVEAALDDNLAGPVDPAIADDVKAVVDACEGDAAGCPGSMPEAENL